MLTFETFVQDKPILINEATDKDFDEVIKNTLNDQEIKVKGNYSLQKRGFQLKLDRRDVDAWMKLFYAVPAGRGKGTGNGEIALFWLFNYKTGKNGGTTHVTQGGNQPDLLINRQNVEVKAYNYPKDGPYSLGRYGDRREFRSMLGTLFGIHNLKAAFEGGTGRGQQTFKGELGFYYKDVVQAAESFIELKDLIYKEKQLQQFQVFRQMKKTMIDFDKMAQNIGHKGDKPEDYGYSLMKYLLEVSLGEKPGDKGYIANAREDNPQDIYFHYIDLKNMVTDSKILQKSIYTGGGQLKAKFGLLFK